MGIYGFWLYISPKKQGHPFLKGTWRRRSRVGWRWTGNKDLGEKARHIFMESSQMFHYMYWVWAFNILKPAQSLCNLWPSLFPLFFFFCSWFVVFFFRRNFYEITRKKKRKKNY
uniref:hypothetical protein n=1 Tax=Exserohilum rostratum TaxID=1659837 RepID=UPI002008EC16|nr:hypothetical protein M1U80_mgp35 [Exserohilum rostratum]UOU81275.1 hypothetical protein [Exserohilum rostratum]